MQKGYLLECAAASIVVVYIGSHAITSCMQGCVGPYLLCTKLVGFRILSKYIPAADQSVGLPAIDVYTTRERLY